MENVNNNETPCCFICYDGNEGEELLCGVCSCRGGNGHCHFSCLVGHGRTKLYGVADSDYFDVDLLRQAWWKCPVCKQFWTDNIFGRMSDEFTAVVSNEFPDDLELEIESQRFKLEAANSENNSNAIKEQEAILCALVSATEEFLSDYGYMTPSVFANQQMAYMRLADIAVKHGDAAKAVQLYVKCRKLLEGVKSNAWSLMKIDVLIARAKAQMPEVDVVSSWRATVKLHDDFYQLTMKEYGRVSEQVLNAGELFATALYESDQLIRYERQLISSYQIARQLHGANHPRSVYIKDDLDYIKQRHAVLVSEKTQFLHVFDYNAKGDKYLLQSADEGVDKFFSVAASGLIFAKGTPAVCRGFEDTNKHLNDRLGQLRKLKDDTSYYVIQFEDENLHSIKITPENFRVVFELP